MEWVEGDGVAIESLRTPYGKLGYSLKRDANRLHLAVESSDFKLPAGGIVFAWPHPDANARTRLNGKPAKWNGDELRILALPANVDIANPISAKTAR